jgi:hypothetical protein
LTLQVVAEPQTTPSPPWPRRCLAISTPFAELERTGVRTIEAALYLTILQLEPTLNTTQPLLVEAASIPIPPHGRWDRALVGLSRAVTSTDGRNAIVFYERICGNCGEGAWVWFQRSSLERPWKLMRRMPLWIG